MSAQSDPEQLTARQWQVLELVANEGLTDKQIAQRLYLSERTVHAHMAAILRKTRLSSRHKLGEWARARSQASPLTVGEQAERLMAAEAEVARLREAVKIYAAALKQMSKNLDDLAV